MHLNSLRNIYSNRDMHGLFRPRPINELEIAKLNQPEEFVRAETISSVSIMKPTNNRNGAEAIYIEHGGLGKATPVKAEGPYKHTYPRAFKEEVVSFAQTNGVRATCRKFSVTRKNVERWCKNGLDRKKGAGRKTTNPAMEVEILAWVEDYIRREGKLPKRNYIIIRASEFTDNAFKASKGWCDKFLKRNKSILQQYLDESKSLDSDD